MMLHWNNIPKKFKQVPQNLEELREYINWLNTKPFSSKERLSGKVSGAFLE